MDEQSLPAIHVLEDQAVAAVEDILNQTDTLWILNITIIFLKDKYINHHKSS